MSESTQSLKAYWLVIGLLLLAIATAGGWKLYQVLAPQRVATATLNKDCDLAITDCNSIFPDGTTVSLSIEPRPIPVLKPLKLTSKINGIDVDSVEVDIVGLGMNMGYIRPELSSIDPNGKFSGDSILPVCILDEMEWEARVMIHSNDGLMVAPFRFVTKK